MTQNIEWNYEDDLTSVKAGRRISEFEPTGIWNGFDLSVETNSSARILPGVMTIGDQQATVNHQVRMEIPDYEIVTSVTPTTPWIVAQWEYTDDEDNEVNLTTMNSYPSDNETIVIAKGEFDANDDLTGFDKSVRTIPRTQILEDYDFIVQSQEDVHTAFEDGDINDIFVQAENGPFELYHTREGRTLDVNGSKTIYGDAGNAVHFTTTSLGNEVGLTVDSNLILDGVSLQIANDTTVFQTVVDYDAEITVFNSTVEAQSSASKLLDLQSSANEFVATVADTTFVTFSSEPISGTTNAEQWSWYANTTEGTTGSWTDDRDLRVVDSRFDAETVDGHPVTRATDFDSASGDELLPQDLINDKLALEGQGIEGSVDTVDNLPTVGNFDAGSIYIVNEDSFDTTNSEVVDSGQNIAYPAGYWMAVNTTGDQDEAEQWELLTRLQTDVDRDEFMELKPSPTSPPSMDVLIQGGRYTVPSGVVTVTNSQTVSITIPSTDPRIDTIVADSNGSIFVIEGTEATNPTPPNTPSGHITAAHVKVSPSTTEISRYLEQFSDAAEGIKDVRPLLNLGGGKAGFEGAVQDVDSLPAIADQDPGTIYAVDEDQFETTNGNIVDSGGDIAYPAGFWRAVDTGTDGVSDQWELVTKNQTDITRDEVNELKPSPTSPPSLDVLIQDGPYSNSKNDETGDPAQNTVTISTPASDARIDVISVTDDFTFNVTQGDVATNPVPPSYPNGEMQIAEVKVSANTTEINQYVDKKSDFDSVDQGIRDVRPLFSLGGGSGGGGDHIGLGTLHNSINYEANAGGGNQTVEMKYDDGSQIFYLEFYGDGSETTVEGVIEFPNVTVDSFDDSSMATGLNNPQGNRYEFISTTSTGSESVTFNLSNVQDDDLVELAITGVSGTDPVVDLISFGDGIVRRDVSDDSVEQVRFPYETQTAITLSPRVYTDVLPAGNTTISLPFGVNYKSEIELSIGGTDQYETEWQLDSANNEINLNESFNSDVQFEVRRIEATATGVGIQRHVEENVASGTREINQSFIVAQDASDIDVYRNNGYAIPGVDYFINNDGNVEFNYDLSAGEDITITKLSGGSTTTSHGDFHSPGSSDAFMSIDHAEGTITRGNDTITVPFDITDKKYIDLTVGGVPQRPSSFTLVDPNTIQLDETVDADMSYFVDADNYIT